MLLSLGSARRVTDNRAAGNGLRSTIAPGPRRRDLTIAQSCKRWQGPLHATCASVAESVRNLLTFPSGYK